MITNDKVIEIFCIIDEFCKNLDAELSKNLQIAPTDEGYKHLRHRKGRMSESEIMTILLCYHFGTFRNFKHYYLFFVKEHLKTYFPTAVSYNRFVELMPRVFFQLMAFMKLYAFGKCSGISFVDSTMIPVCHNVRRYFNKVFDGVAKSGKGTMGWCHGFKLHFLCNDTGEVMTFCLTPANVDDRDKRVWSVFTKVLYGKVFADRGYIKQELFEQLFGQGIHLVHGLKAKMKNKLMPMYDKIMLRKRYIIECINELLKNKANLVHSRHRSIHNFVMNLCSALAAYCFFENKPEALPVHIENIRQLELF
ncbi:IS982 family transposase [Prevotella sp. A2931]|uniref:IS982 family transposase n=1 Tax=Prevotella illustrans TaxID=2800387 RepID=A0ABS3M8J6_9BACT|nr:MULTISPECIES: IS982 family transposase [Prevotella]MBO1364515.1 IS982 family transposase [Prevotella illustrans]PTL25132.1 IS982 family transposase [Prevotella sp. oral taxon 820]PTL25141.1 IS982 family transposase [Prevotella sp. oral taxon 820]PTL25373.1 IS982 family transposase [Prevotella sp. oral taxon 820]PTL26633.1 IS982 family transposase [Prevotella sp. oral taxon 820]